MTLDDRKAQIVRLVRLGMDWYTAAIATECSDADLASLESDESFQRRIRVENALEEGRLLTKYDLVIDAATERGIGGPIQWKLEKINPKRWGPKADGGGTQPVRRIRYEIVEPLE